MSSYKKDTVFGTMIDVEAAIYPPFSGAGWFAFMPSGSPGRPSAAQVLSSASFTSAQCRALPLGMDHPPSVGEGPSSDPLSSK